MAAELVEVERNIWSKVLYPNGTMTCLSEKRLIIIRKDKTRLTGYRKDKIIGPAVESTRVKELQQQFQKGISKEDLE